MLTHFIARLLRYSNGHPKYKAGRWAKCAVAKRGRREETVELRRRAPAVVVRLAKELHGPLIVYGSSAVVATDAGEVSRGQFARARSVTTRASEPVCRPRTRGLRARYVQYGYHVLCTVKGQTDEEWRSLGEACPVHLLPRY